MMIDIHAHLNLENFPISPEHAIKAAQKAGVTKFIIPSIDLETSKRAAEIAEQFPDICYAAVGIHPINVIEDENLEDAIKDLKQIATNDHVVAIGETGMDYYHFSPEQTRKKQQDYFIAQLQIAQALKKPVIIHGRKAYDDILPILKQQPFRGVLHSFEAPYDIAKQALDSGLYLSFTALITYPNYQWLREVITKIPLDRIMIETDSPYLIPQAIKDRLGLKGPQNQPAYLVETAKAVADLKTIDLDTVAKITSENARNLFEL